MKTKQTLREELTDYLRDSGRLDVVASLASAPPGLPDDMVDEILCSYMKHCQPADDWDGQNCSDFAFWQDFAAACQDYIPADEVSEIEEPDESEGAIRLIDKAEAAGLSDSYRFSISPSAWTKIEKTLFKRDMRHLVLYLPNGMRDVTVFFGQSRNKFLSSSAKSNNGGGNSEWEWL